MISFVVFFIAIVVLIKSGSVVVTKLTRIAHFLQLSEFAVSFLLVAIATSLPDIFVSVSAALRGAPELAFSNIIGANIITLTLATGVAALVAGGLSIKRETIRKDAFYAGLAAILPVLLFLDGVISRIDGVILLLFAGWYFITVIFQRERFTKIFSNSNHSLFDFWRFLKDFTILIIALIVLVASADGVTRSAVSIAEVLNISLPIIGILLVAMSITLPEIVFGVRAVFMGHKNMVMGNIIGSIVVNSGIAIGLAALINPIEVLTFSPMLSGMLFTVIVAAAFVLITFTNQRISKSEAILLIVLYLIFLLVILSQGGASFMG